MKKAVKFYFILFSICFYIIPASSKTNPIDSLQAIVKNAKNDSVKVDALIELVSLNKDDTFLNYINQTLELAQKIGYKNGIAAVHLALGKYHYHKENFSISLLHCITAYNLARETKNNIIMAWACLYIGYNNYLSQPEIALKYYFKCIEQCRLCNCKAIAAYGYSAVGNVYESREEATNALRYYNMSLQIRNEVGTKRELVSSIIETARAHNRLQDYLKSAELVKEALEIAEVNQVGNEQNLVYLYEMTGYDVAGRLNDYKTALVYFLKSYNMATENKLNATNSVKPIAEMYLKLGDYKNSSRYYKIYNDLLELNQKKRFKEILKADEVIKQELEKEKLIALASEKEITSITLQKQNAYRNMYIAFVLVLIVFIFFMYRNSHLKEKLNQNLESQVKQRTYDLENLTNKLLHSEKRLTDANKELESFIYRTSHDLKGPLASSKGLVSLALNSDKPDEVWDYVRMIGKSINKLDWILVTLYEVSVIRKGMVSLKDFDIEVLLNTLHQNLSDYVNYNKIKFTIENKLDGPFVSDELLTQTILRNLLENTVKYSRLGIPNPYVNIILTDEENYNVITIEDNGIGIKPEFKDKIFDPFVRANDSTTGSGLGLYIVKNAIDKLDGRIELVKSEPHVGTVFKLYFPKQAII